MTSALAPVDWAALMRVLAVANGKGGVGKTSTAAHLAGQVAESGQRVLLIDLDPQGNIADDLGMKLTDDGASILHAVMIPGTDLFVVKDVRPRLDVVPGGVRLNELSDHFHSRRMRMRDDSSLLDLARAIARYAGDYALVVIDCPPANSDVLQDAALCTSRYLLVPTHSDKSSRKGLAEMARRFGQLRDLNPYLELLGVLLFGVTTSATTVRRMARQWIEAALGGHAPVFDTSIRHVEAVAFDIREKGLLAHELPPVRRHDNGDPVLSELAADYQGMAKEVLRRIVDLEAAQRERAGKQA